MSRIETFPLFGEWSSIRDFNRIYSRPFAGD